MSFAIGVCFTEKVTQGQIHNAERVALIANTQFVCHYFRIFNVCPGKLAELARGAGGGSQATDIG